MAGQGYKSRQKADEEAGRRAYAAGCPYQATASGAWRRGWKRARQRAGGILITPQEIAAGEQKMLARISARQSHD